MQICLWSSCWKLRTLCFFFSSRRRHTRSLCDWSSDVCSSDLHGLALAVARVAGQAAVLGVVGTGAFRARKSVLTAEAAGREDGHFLPRFCAFGRSGSLPAPLKPDRKSVV